MARLPRLALSGVPHHLLLQAVGKRSLFVDESDCLFFLALMQQTSNEFSLALHAYVLLPAEVQLACTPAEGAALGRAVQAIARRYVRRFNARHGQRGTLFEARFRAAVVQPGRHLLASMRFIESRAVALGLVDDPASYRWSSYRHHAGIEFSPLLRDHAAYWALGNTPYERHAAYAGFVFEDADRAADALLERAVRGGWAIGDAGFLAEVGAHRQPVPALPGRPRK